jgi:hypothetical protein
MADSTIAITAGTGTAVDTRTEATNGHHRQVVVLGDPSTNAGVAPVDATAGLKVDLGADNDVVVTNAGTFATQATLQAGSAAIGKLAANSGVDIGDVDVTSSALPTGASTSAKQPALGTAGTASTDVITVQGIASMTALKVDGSAVTQPVSGTVTANLSATDNAVLDDIASDTEAIKTSLAGTLTVTGGGGGTEYTEDVATANPIVGTATMIERDDALTTVTPIEGDNIGLRGTAEGALWTQDFNSDGILADTTAIKTSLETAGGQLVNLGANNDVTITGTATVSATNLDIRDLTNTDVVTAELSAVDNAVLDTIAAKDFATQTTLAAMNAKMVTGTDIGDVTINNASGASAVNIQDGGNTITVDGTVAVTNSDITSIKTAVEVIDNAISGNEMQVDVLTMPTTNTKGLPSDIDINGSNANHADKYYTNAGAVTDGIVWSPAAGKRWHVLTLYINVSAAATVTLEDDLAGGDVARWKGELAANSGVILTYDKEHPFCSGEDAADLIITTSAGNVYVQAVGYEV